LTATGNLLEKHADSRFLGVAAVNAHATIVRRQHWFLASLLVLVASLTLLSPPQHWRDRGWFDDGGLTLDTADQLLQSKQLFSDAFYQYGPVSVEPTFCGTRFSEIPYQLRVAQPALSRW
jgi:hypothetical protein